MPIIPTDVLDVFKEIYKETFHNTLVRVRKITGSTVDSGIPYYSDDATNVLTIYDDFSCSIYNMLSGKVNRVFEERNMPTLEAMGIIDEEIYVIQYVCDEELETGGPLNNLQLGEEVEIATGEWWKVKKVVEDSESLQHTAILTK